MRRFLAVLLAAVITLGCLPCGAAGPAQIVLLTQDGTRIEGTRDTAVTIRYGMYDIDTSLFSWGGYRHGEYGYLSINLSDDQVDWAKSQEGPATLEINGQVFAGTVTCWIPTNWVLSFHPEDGDDSPAGQAIHDALYAPSQDDAYTLSPDTDFVDVKEGDWFAPYVDVCAKAGLMVGVGYSRFAPEKTLSWQECAILALRLHQMGQGGEGIFDPAPAEWNYYTLRAQADDMLVSAGYLDCDNQGTDLHWVPLGRHSASELGFYLATETEKAWGLEMDYRAVTLTVNGVAYAGTLHLTNQKDVLYFLPNEEADISPLRNSADLQVGAAWWRDGWYYAQQNGLEELIFASDARWAFARRMAKVVDLPVINDIADDAIPDLDPRSVISQDILALYRAGVLTGTDQYGTFDGRGTLTRAQAAAICARMLRPELRVRFSLPDPQEG